MDAWSKEGKQINGIHVIFSISKWEKLKLSYINGLLTEQ